MRLREQRRFEFAESRGWLLRPMSLVRGLLDRSGANKLAGRVRLLVGRRGVVCLSWAIVLVPVVLVGLFLAFQHKPGWYQPVRPSDRDIQRARDALVEQSDEVSDQMVTGMPFEVVLKDRSVNEWLGALGQLWPQSNLTLPQEILDPAVHFDTDCIRIGARYESKSWKAIVSLILTLRVLPDGSALEITLSGARGGSLPIPHAVLEAIVGDLIETARAGGSSGSRDGDQLISLLRDVRDPDELFNGLRVDNRFVWFNGKRPFRIAAIRVAGGELRLKVEPL